LLVDPEDPQRLAGVVLTDGTTVAADVIVESVGSHPNVEWLDGNGLDLGNGVLCDNHMRVASRPGVVAVGDVARFPHPAYGGPARRIEHWCVPTDTAKRAATTLIADLEGWSDDSAIFSPLPAFWSDQYDVRLQGYGAPGDADTVRAIEGVLPTNGQTAPEPGTVIGYYRGDALLGVVMVTPTSAQNLHYRAVVDAARADLVSA
jgi:NADPH-dependent 2,4-dienoyl-CoA reductase/sulfur reductase-like enzyme